MKKIVIFILFFTFTFNVKAEIVVDSLWIRANEAYTAGSYEEAARIYSSIEGSGQVSPDLFYNMGNTYFKQNALGKAILYYERALKLKPEDTDISYNLEIANSMTVDKIEAVPEFFLSTWIKDIRGMVSADTWAIASLLLFALCLILLGLFFFARNISIRKFSFILSIILLLACFGSGFFAYYQKKALYNTSAAIIFPAVVTVKSSPDATGKDLFILHEGTKVFILETLGEWQRIRLIDGKQGWINKLATEKI
jgi:tetratricopeptide (TPR) repeat protein